MTLNTYIKAILCAGLAAMLAGCAKEAKSSPAAEAPPPAQVEKVGDPNSVKVDHPEQFPVAVADKFSAATELTVTGTVSADISRAVPVITLANGRILEIHARLGDTVTKGQLLLRVQSADISGAYSDYRQAVADLTLAKAQRERSQMLLDRGAIAMKDMEVAIDAEDKAKVTVETTIDHLKVLGSDPSHPTSIVDVFAPISGVITDQQVTAAAGVQGLASPNPFTISDLSTVWILCDVFENDLRNVRMNENADVRLNAYPDQLLKGKVSNIGPILDPNMRTAKVRLEMANPGNMRVGMFATATFHSADAKMHVSVPASAILHLHDRDWVYEPADANTFRRVEVVGGKMLPDGKQEVVSGLSPGDKVVSNALVLQNSTQE